jgi:uncharacterized peroxidase-related enzyme
MTSFPLHTPETAPESIRATLYRLERALGFLPNLYAKLAESPETLKAYLALSEAFGKTSLSSPEQQVVLLAASVENGCQFCVAAHSLLAANAGMPRSEIEALRAQKPLLDDHLGALATFVREMVRQRGWVEPANVDRFLAAGFERRHVLEVVLGISLKTLSNYANHLVETPLNEQFARGQWSHSRTTPA